MTKFFQSFYKNGDEVKRTRAEASSMAVSKLYGIPQIISYGTGHHQQSCPVWKWRPPLHGQIHPKKKFFAKTLNYLWIPVESNDSTSGCHVLSATVNRRQNAGSDHVTK